MKTRALFFLALFAIGCKKEDNEEMYLYGVVQDKYTHSPIAGITVNMQEGKPGIFGGYTVFSSQTKTDKNGLFWLKYTPNEGHTVTTVYPEILDTNQITCKYIEGYTSLKENELKNKLIIELLPSGAIATFISNTTWKILPADTVVVSSPFATDTLYRISSGERVYFNVEPSQFTQFNWYYIKKGVRGKIISKQIYVPNFFKDSKGNATDLFYELTF